MTVGVIPAACMVTSAILAGMGFAATPGVAVLGLPSPATDDRAGHRRSLTRVTTHVLERVGRIRAVREISGSSRMVRRLELAGLASSADAVVGLGATAGAGLALLGLAGASTAPTTLALCPIGLLVCARGPSTVLAKHARRRQDRISMAVPSMVEVMVAATEAGLGPALAFRRTAEVLGGPIGDELRLTAREVDLGLPWETALHRLAGRTDVPSLRGLVAALTRSSKLGTSLASTLRRVADDLRRERRARAEELARKAPIKMLFPLVFLILPAFLLLTVGPVLLATIRSLS
jgi:tight adherence protein C